MVLNNHMNQDNSVQTLTTYTMYLPKSTAYFLLLSITSVNSGL